MVFKFIKIPDHKVGLYFHDEKFVGLLEAGRHWFFDPLRRVHVDVVSLRTPWFTHEKLDVIVKSGVLEGRALVLDLKDHERALVWIDGRFSHVVPPGLYVYWTTDRDVKTEIVDARSVRFTHVDLNVIAKSLQVEKVLEIVNVPANHTGVYFRDGNFVETLPPGRYAFWKNMADVKVVPVDTR